MITSLQLPLNSKSTHQLPLITKKQTKITSPTLEKMKSLHVLNIRTIKKQQTQNENSIQHYFENKSHYFNTIHQKKNHSVQRVLKDLNNKSTIIEKQNLQKTKRHTQNYRSLVSLTKQKIKNSYLKEKQKAQMAQTRKQNFMASHTKQVFVKKPNYRRLYLEELGKSQQLHKVTIQKLMDAQNRRKQIRKSIQNSQKGKINQSIYYASQYVQLSQNQKEKRLLQKSIAKLKQTERIVNQQKVRNRSNSESSRKSSQERLLKAQGIRKQKQKQMIQKLEKILQQKYLKTSTINQRKQKNLESLSNSLKKSRSQHLQEAQKKSRSLFLDAQFKSGQIMHENHEKWKFLTGLKTQFNKIKNKNLYECQQVSLRS